MLSQPIRNPVNQRERTFRLPCSCICFAWLLCSVATFFPSTLQADLAKTVGVYTQTLHLDPGWFPFHLTDGVAGQTAFYRWQVIELGDDGSERVIRELPSDQQPTLGGFRRIRQEAFVRFAASIAADETLDDEICATMARAIAVHYLRANAAKTDPETVPGAAQATTTSKKLLVRCVGPDFEAAAEDPEDEVLYAADAWLSKSNEINVLKRMAARRTAPPAPSPQVP